MTQLRKVKYKLENSKTSKVGFFHIFKKNISENGSEIILGIIEDDKTGELHEISIANFLFSKEKISKQKNKHENSFTDTLTKFPLDLDNDLHAYPTDEEGNYYDNKGNLLGNFNEQSV